MGLEDLLALVLESRLAPLLTAPSFYGKLYEKFLDSSSMREGMMHVRFLGKDPESQVGQSPTLYATDRTDRTTYIAQGWKVTDPQVLAEVGSVPDHETLIEIPEDVLKFYARRYLEEGDR